MLIYLCFFALEIIILCLSLYFGFARLYRYYKTVGSIKVILGTSNMLIIGSIIFVCLAMNGADGPVGFGIAFFVAPFFLLGLLMHSVGMISLLIHAFQRLDEDAD